ncbi:Regulator of nonsense transcripts 1 [Oopsacas minuta]|uniref:Regulator of nonsense transcripts 1 n=1 Tax=Oopsacas minuta TaxID=111878 RepID=A0AAV7K0N8_9METZ|nr:Regulator of nonsense transcripts 1 [Oopsacas minuta]
MSRIILCGANSVGKTTLAQDWCSMNKNYQICCKVRRDVMVEHKISSEDIHNSLRSCKKIFFKLQRLIFEEQYRRESQLGDALYICSRGPEPLVDAFLENSRKADILSEQEIVKKCLDRYRASLVVLLCPLENAPEHEILPDSTKTMPISLFEEQKRFTKGLHDTMTTFGIPYMYMDERDREKRVEILKLAVEGTVPIPIEQFMDQRCLSFFLDTGTKRRATFPPPLLPLPKQGKEDRVRTFDLNPGEILLSYPPMDSFQTNRMVDRYGEDNFVLLQFHSKLPNSYIRDVLRKGVYVNGDEFQFLGCSSSGLKGRKCYLLKGNIEDVRVVLEQCGNFSKIKMVSKRLKRISQLFSVAMKTGVMVPDDKVEDIEDIETSGGNFTDGCGLVGLNLASKLAKGCNALIECPEDGVPTVFQIRFLGCKGILTKSPHIDTDSMKVRKSMRKFSSGTEPFPEVWVCEHSRPYSYGHLNKQYIMLLSGLGIRDEVFLTKQADYLKALESMLIDPSFAITILNWRNRPDLAAFVAERETFAEFRREDIQNQLRYIRSKLILKLEKLSIPILDSRTLFGVCDPLNLMEYGECFIRISVQGKPQTLHPGTKVTVGKNPCYLLGDVRVLTAVDHPELNHLIDCMVFPVKGRSPHSAEIAGSDLDGDQYFVCWDKDLIPPHTVEPYDYPSVEAHPSDTVTREMMIDYFSGQKNMMGKINDYYEYWADIEGPGCFQCEQLGAWFSRSVDSSKTGDIVRIPRHLIPPQRERKSDKVWVRMQEIAADCKERLSGDTADEILENSSSAYVIEEDFIRNLLENTKRGISEYKLFSLLYKWCDAQKISRDERREKLIELSDYINFGLLTMKEREEAIQLGIPVANVMNALSKSRLLNKEMLQPFYLDIPTCGWKFYFRGSTANLDWRHIFYAMTSYPETLLVLKLPYYGERLAFHLIGTFEDGESIIPKGSIISYFFSPPFGYNLRYVTECDYNLNLTPHMIQIYRSDVRNTFLWLKNECRSDSGSEYDRISIDLTRFKRTIRRVDKHPLILKLNFHSVEVFVKSNNIEDTVYFDILETDQVEHIVTTGIESSDILEELPSDSEEEREEVDPSKYTPYAPETSLLALKEFAKKGDSVNFRKVITIIPSPTPEIPQFPRTLLTEEILSLLTNMVIHQSHRKTSESTIEDLYAIFKSDHIAIPSAKDLLFLFTCLSKLQLFDMATQLSDKLISKVDLSGIAQYFDTIFHWEWWCFLSLNLACELSDKLYLISCKLDAGKKPAENTQNTDDFETNPDLLQNLAVAANDDPPPLEEIELNNYKRYYAYLMLKHLLEETPGREENEKVKDTEDSVCMLRVLHSEDRRVNVEIDSSSSSSNEEENEETVPVKQVKKKKKKKSKTWKACFSRINKVTSNKFSIGSFVKIRLMNRLATTHSGEPIALGSISVYHKSPADIIVDILEPVPEAIKRAARLKKGFWCLTLLGNITSFKRSSKALQNLYTPGILSILTSPQAFPPTIAPKDYEVDFLAVSPDPVELPDKSTPIHNPYHSYKGCTACERRDKTRYNQSQENAIQAALTQRLILIHGPPGTGKTFVACEIVHQLFHEMNKQPDKDEKCKILVAAETNNAVDNLTYNLVKLNMRVVRVGNKNQIGKHLHDYSLAHQVEMKRIQLGQDKKGEYQCPKLKKEILNSVDIIATTCTGAGDNDLKTLQFSCILIDEATQAIEPVSLISIAKSCKKLILIGDPKQLAPILPSNRESRGHTCPVEVPRFEALCETLFHRLHKNIKTYFLDEQHRMHPYIADFPSKVFYSGKLKTAVRKEDRIAPKLGFMTSNKPIVFIDVDHPEHRTGSSIRNEREADIIVDIIKQLTGLAKYKDTEIAILTPYTAQVKCLKEKLALVSKVEVSSIDAFQGKEKEVIVFSTVRNNDNGVLGFTDSPYRINVLLTRAKCGLIGVGNRDTLRGSNIWSEWTFQHTLLTVREFYENATVNVNEDDEIPNQNNNNSRRGTRSRGRPQGYQNSSRDRNLTHVHQRHRPNIGCFVSDTLRSHRRFRDNYREDIHWRDVPVDYYKTPRKSEDKDWEKN